MRDLPGNGARCKWRARDSDRSGPEPRSRERQDAKDAKGRWIGVVPDDSANPRRLWRLGVHPVHGTNLSAAADWRAGPGTAMQRLMTRTMTVDCDYLGPGFAAAYLMHDGARAAFVDDNTAHAVPRLLAALEGEGLAPHAVEAIAVTHVHLDHAGGTGALALACPDAVVLCHPRAVRHLVDPSRLEASARAVYGDERFEHLYGRLLPVDASRVRAVGDDEVVPVAGRRLRFLHVRGHANHHVAILDEDAGEVFSGDSFGLAYPALQKRGLFVFPSTSPTDFDPAEARASVRRVAALRPRRVMLAHFGELTAVDEAARQLESFLDVSEALLDEAAASAEPDDALDAFCARRLEPRFLKTAHRWGFEPDDSAMAILRLDLDLNAAGIAHAARRRRAPTRP